jgi:hypothetical protein
MKPAADVVAMVVGAFSIDQLGQAVFECQLRVLAEKEERKNREQATCRELV